MDVKKLNDPFETGVAKLFRDKYGNNYRLFRSPGRINLIGEHTDYNLGYVLPTSINHAIYFAINKSSNKQHSQVYSTNFDQTLDLDHQKLHVERGSWKSYIQACCLLLKQSGYTFEGVNCVIGGNIPVGAGLSSSAALTCGFIYALNTLYHLGLSRVDIAKMAQAAEHLIGVNCGIMDQFAVLFGKKDHVFRLDCRDLTYQYFPLSLENYDLILINSRVEHELVDSAYNDRRADCEFVLNQLKIKFPKVHSLREVDQAMLKMVERLITETQMKQVQYVLEENQRVLATCQALESGEIEKVGQYLYASHKGLSNDYEVSCPELDLLVDLSKKQGAILGSRMMGGGFGGCTINLLEKNNRIAVKTIMEKYQQETGIEPTAHPVSTGNGVGEVLVD